MKIYDCMHVCMRVYLSLWCVCVCVCVCVCACVCVLINPVLIKVTYREHMVKHKHKHKLFIIPKIRSFAIACYTHAHTRTYIANTKLSTQCACIQLTSINMHDITVIVVTWTTRPGNKFKGHL